VRLNFGKKSSFKVGHSVYWPPFFPSRGILPLGHCAESAIHGAQTTEKKPSNKQNA
jgi:hypothetical protein